MRRHVGNELLVVVSPGSPVSAVAAVAAAAAAAAAALRPAIDGINTSLF